MAELQQRKLQLSQLSQLTDITNTLLQSSSSFLSKAGGGEGSEKLHQALQSLRDDSGCELMDDSLTDMQWLQRMDAGADFPGLAQQGRKRGRASKGKDGCRKKLDYSSRKFSNKPPLSYASIIALAICSTPQRMMTLNSIYRWIEGTFPFYRTPEAKAWKNSIRHNLSIRKNMFMKVYQYPPRRGNGSYWTLLSDGEEELKRAIPLFSTLLPPVIDDTSIYNRVPATHTVKSKGQYVPVLPNLDGAVSQPYFAIETTVNTVEVPQSLDYSFPSVGAHSEVATRKKATLSRHSTPRHLLDHSYAKQACERGEEEDSGHLSESSDHESTFDAPTPKRNRCSSTSVHRPLHEQSPTPSHDPEGATTQAGGGRIVCTPPSADPQKDNSLNLLDSSFLTPVKNLVPDIEMSAISLSPLYNFITPGCGNTPFPTSLPSPFTPLESLRVGSGLPDVDVFSTPLKTDPLRFSTPFSPLRDLLPQNTFALPQDTFPALRDFDSPMGFGTVMPSRPGSLQPFGLPGFTPPSATHLRT